MDDALRTHIHECESQLETAALPELGRDLWTNHDIVRYYSRLQPDHSQQHLAEEFRTISPSPRRILVVGGAVGRLGRCIAQKNPAIEVVEVDSSPLMVEEANRLAKQEGIEQCFRSEYRDGFHLLYESSSFDYVIAHGFMRWFDSFQQIELLKEMNRVTRYNTTIAEGRLKEVISSVSDLLPEQKKEVREASVPMLRMTLFFGCMKRYEQDNAFKDIVDAQRRSQDHVEFLLQCAGNYQGRLYQLRIKKFY